MRIRTVKPEFWTHPVMARQTDHAQLIALGLLNYADDYGYFFADPKLVRSALRPFDDDSTNVHRSLDSLVKAGYIEVREHPTHGNLGRVVSFLNHQRVDRPKDSVIKELFDSTNDRRMIDDQSPLEWKGMEGKGKEGNGETGKPSISRFVKPTEEEVLAYSTESKHFIDAAKFVSYYESNGWRVGRNPMKDWKAAVRTWAAQSSNYQRGQVKPEPQNVIRPNLNAPMPKTTMELMLEAQEAGQ